MNSSSWEEQGSLSPFWPVQEHLPLQRKKSFCFVLHLQGVELACSTRCFMCEDISGKALVPGTDTGMNMDVSSTGLPPVDQKHRSGQTEATVLTCSLCRQDLPYVGAWLLPCQHLLCKDCFQGLTQELWQVAKAHGTVSDGKYKSPAGSPPSM